MAQSAAFDSNTGQWPSYLGYQPLERDSTEIRVLKLIPNASNSDLSYSLSHTEFNSSVFAALSYSWGAPVPRASMSRIFIEGELVLIRPTLRAFLTTLASCDVNVSIWIDAICINQNDVVERNSQISMMGDIYRMASKVYVWLGVGDDDTNYALEHITSPQPQTTFDKRQFSPCAEKLFRVSYWTRRWVIQEFALAQQPIVVCGSYTIPWSKIVEKIDNQILENDEVASYTMTRFKQLHDPDSQGHLSLLELMIRYQKARCVDSRDRAFALRGIARDGELLVADYRETTTDVYFRILSQMPTERVLPKMVGYRWPHRAASQLQDCLSLSMEEIVDSLSDKPSDRIFGVLEYTGIITSVHNDSSVAAHSSFNKVVLLSYETSKAPFFSRYVKPQSGLQRADIPMVGAGSLEIGDLVYALELSNEDYASIYVSFKPDQASTEVTGVLLEASDISNAETERLEICDTMRRIYVAGIRKCIRNSALRPSKTRILCHLSRIAMIALWLCAAGRHHDCLKFNVDHKNRNVGVIDSCNCDIEHNDTSTTTSCMTDDSSAHLEILPVVRNMSNRFAWKLSHEFLLKIPGDQRHRTSIKSTLQHFHFEGHSLTHAAAEGLMGWLNYMRNSELMQQPSTASQLGESQEYNPNIWLSTEMTPLMQAAAYGQLEAVKFLLQWRRQDPNLGDSQGRTPLLWAIMSGHRGVVDLLLADETIDPNINTRSASTPLSWAAQMGNPGIVKALLASKKTDPSIGDLDAMTPLLWAARYGHEEVVRLLLATKQVDCNAKDNPGRTPLSWAAGNGFTGIVKLLLAESETEPDLFDGERWTPLRWAAKGKHTKAFKLLLATKRVRNNVKYDYQDESEDGT